VINGKTYYQILGVLEDAEDIVIRAAYKVLAQKYHPDKWSGSKEEATQRMSEINQAYGTLSDVNRRKSYDETLIRGEYTDATESAQSDVEVSQDWNAVLTYYPDLEELSKSLRRISTALEYTFKLILLEQKDFERRALVAQELEKKFLERYFGTNKEILKFAKLLIVGGHKDAAKELNKAVNLLGSSVNPVRIVKRISDDFLSEKPASSEYPSFKDNASTRAAKKVLSGGDNPYDIAKDFLTLLGFRIQVSGIWNMIYHVEKGSEKKILSSVEYLRYARKVAEEVLDGKFFA
jgi:curved DNA-binding protein CbpA